ncbi:Uncharacterized protein GBIM_10302 [Gryllus bimaculatus]|nr:Uncharacterized protein GBIM_10302 [Gryllus bimaculatus]
MVPTRHLAPYNPLKTASRFVINSRNNGLAVALTLRRSRHRCLRKDLRERDWRKSCNEARLGRSRKLLSEHSACVIESSLLSRGNPCELSIFLLQSVVKAVSRVLCVKSPVGPASAVGEDVIGGAISSLFQAFIVSPERSSDKPPSCLALCMEGESRSRGEKIEFTCEQYLVILGCKQRTSEYRQLHTSVLISCTAKLETKALKAKRPGFTDDRYNETSYYIENGEY